MDKSSSDKKQLIIWNPIIRTQIDKENQIMWPFLQS